MVLEQKLYKSIDKEMILKRKRSVLITGMSCMNYII